MAKIEQQEKQSEHQTVRIVLMVMRNNNHQIKLKTNQRNFSYEISTNPQIVQSYALNT